QPRGQVAPNRYRGSASEPSGAETGKVSLPAQENHRVPSAGVSKGQLDLVGGSGQGANRLPREPIPATPRRSAQLVHFALRTGNQQFASKSSSEGKPPAWPGPVRSCNQSDEVGIHGVCVHHGIKSHKLRCLAARSKTLVPCCLSSAPH